MNDNLDKVTETPVIVVGWPTIARLIHGKAVSLRDAELLPSDEIMNEAMRISMSKSNASITGGGTPYRACTGSQSESTKEG